MIYESHSENETYNIGLELGRNAKPGQVFCLNGDLGVGKTVFTKGFAKGLGIDEVISSPTFTIVCEYQSETMPFYHFDVYRIGHPDEMYEIGFEEYLYGGGVCLIEWASLIEDILPDNIISITIEKDLSKDLDYRKITLDGER